MRNLLSIRIPVAYCTLVLLAGCGATLKTERLLLSNVSSNVNGLAVNQSVPHDVYVIFPEAPSSKKLVTLKTRGFLTSSTELYTINYRGALFATRQLEVDLNGDSSVKRVKVTSAQQLPEALESLASAAKSAGNVQKNLASPASPNPLMNENTSIELQLKNLMLQANLNAIKQGIAPPYPGIGVPSP